MELFHPRLMTETQAGLPAKEKDMVSLTEKTDGNPDGCFPWDPQFSTCYEMMEGSRSRNGVLFMSSLNSQKIS